MKVEIIKSHTLKKNTWSGGTTTQFFIYPHSAEYSKLNFDFRLSMATVAIKESVFTSLPGVSRKLLVLEGEITLDHENRHQKKLGRFDMDEFEGDWKTSSVGKCTDFNLMTKEETTGKLIVFDSKQNENIQYSMKNKEDWLFIYNYSGSISVEVNKKTHVIDAGDLLIIRERTNTLHIKPVKDSILVFAEITKKQPYESI
ncbi:HutD/Ves family protein [Aquimarina muelleri]|uniref:HutD-family protein n=1 Tax=Aquimarina muelleri TaxID=279356 RepID=A0A918N2U0_9FLAO|nr:HutD family protein [Aquimarina muelleri]MCX2761747.1 HutD family protein [Aquimarina muelleri]GGX15880.1 hypothetical protein GCM10007384_16780 [Aquimarina muelleri]